MDIVGKLRGKYWPEKTAREAMTEIRRLRITVIVQQSVLESLAEFEEGENKRLREALQNIADGPWDVGKSYVSLFHEIQSKARKALGEEE
jgi:hypothetical protein